MSGTASLVLYVDRFWISPYAFTCFVAMREKALAFDVRAVALDAREQLAPEYRDGSLTARVPSLRHGDTWISESSAIVEYLEEAFPRAPPVLPESIVARARARQVMAWLRSDLGALREERPTTTMFYARADRPLTAARSAAADKLVRVATQVVAERVDTFEIADADLAFMLQRLILNGHEVPHALRDFAGRIWTRPSVAEFVAHERPPYVAY